MRRKLSITIVAAMTLVATIVISTPAASAPPKSCAEIYRGLRVASMCVDYTNPAPGHAVGSGYWRVMSPRIENNLNGGAEQIWAIYFNNDTGRGLYLGRLDDGERWTGGTSTGRLTAKFEVAMDDGWTRCVYLIPTGSNTEVGHC